MSALTLDPLSLPCIARLAEPFEAFRSSDIQEFPALALWFEGTSFRTESGTGPSATGSQSLLETGDLELAEPHPSEAPNPWLLSPRPLR